MVNLKELLKIIALAGALLTAIITVLKNLAEIYKLLRPLGILVIFLGTIVVPNGLLIWGCLYSAAINSSRLEEAETFFLLIAQFTVAASIYTFCWGKWFYPKLGPWLKRQLMTVQTSPEQTEDNQKRDEKKSSETNGIDQMPDP